MKRTVLRVKQCAQGRDYVQKPRLNKVQNWTENDS